ncbi:MAG: hypothetical protein HY815_12310 [Candidatus Riflebacteria bacterium]|nr:hypothetical protein [Candidatus Riflebacteria bacterium]
MGRIHQRARRIRRTAFELGIGHDEGLQVIARVEAAHAGKVIENGVGIA